MKLIYLIIYIVIVLVPVFYLLWLKFKTFSVWYDVIFTNNTQIQTRVDQEKDSIEQWSC